MSAEQLHRRHWSVEEFQNAVRLGVFREDEHLELLYGEIIARKCLQTLLIPLRFHYRLHCCKQSLFP
ncbi:MAG: hypothetical protein QM758_19750 [Armatimonas sp.]